LVFDDTRLRAEGGRAVRFTPTGGKGARAWPTHEVLVAILGGVKRCARLSLSMDYVPVLKLQYRSSRTAPDASAAVIYWNGPPPHHCRPLPEEYFYSYMACESEGTLFCSISPFYQAP